MTRVDVRFTRETEDGIQRIVAHFSTDPQLVTAVNEFDLRQLTNKLNVAADEFNTCGSGFVFERVKCFVLIITQFKPLNGGSSFVPTPLTSPTSTLWSTYTMMTSVALSGLCCRPSIQPKTIPVESPVMQDIVIP